LETFLKGEALISEFEIRVGETISSVFNENNEIPVKCLKSFLASWNEDYNEDSVLFESFSKFINKVLKKCNSEIESDEYKTLMNEMFKVGRSQLHHGGY